MGARSGFKAASETKAVASFAEKMSKNKVIYMKFSIINTFVLSYRELFVLVGDLEFDDSCEKKG